MDQVAEDVWQIPLAPRHCVNAYLLGDLVVDAGSRGLARRVVSAVRGHAVAAHAITHAHADHVGGSARVVEALGVPMWAPADDAEAVEAGRQVIADTWARPLMRAGARFDAVPVARRLREGDEVGAGFVVIDSPGHSPGHVSFWRERDRVLVCGDVFFNLHLATLRYGLREPPAIFTPDPARNRRSARRLAELEPELALFGHGAPLRDPGALARFAAAVA